MLPFPPFSWHHLHPILVNYTAALIPASVGCDAMCAIFRRKSLGNAAWWMIFFALLATPLTAVAGWALMRATVDASGMSPVMRVHEWLGISVAIVLTPITVYRGMLHNRGQSPGIAYFASASVLVVALIYQGHLGGSMSFG